jgi:hypothetical protein
LFHVEQFLAVEQSPRHANRPDRRHPIVPRGTIL